MSALINPNGILIFLHESAMQKAIFALNELQTEVIFFSAGTMYATPSSTIQALQHKMTSDFVVCFSIFDAVCLLT